MCEEPIGTILWCGKQEKVGKINGILVNNAWVGVWFAL